MNQEIAFYKYQGTGNDFVMIDNRNMQYQLTTTQIAHLCDRRFGIGADGLILLQLENGYDFRMVYYNSDGNESTMCGNGGRCILKFAHDLKLIQEKASFVAIDGPHDGAIHDIITLHMQDVPTIQTYDDHVELNTGSPHYVIFSKDIDEQNIVEIGRKIRYSDRFPQGINVNLVEKINDHTLQVRTYERGVEDETLSCGTGVVASVLSYHQLYQPNTSSMHIKTKGGNLEVSFQSYNSGYRDIYLKGPAEQVFKGVFPLS